MIAVIIQTKKMVSNEVRQLSNTRAIVWKKTSKVFGQPNKVLFSVPANNHMMKGYQWEKMHIHTCTCMLHI